MAELDRERIPAKLDQLHSYAQQLEQIAPQSFEEHQNSRTSRPSGGKY